MIHARLSPFWLAALFGFVPVIAWSAPAPKGLPRLGPSEQEEAVALEEMSELDARNARERTTSNLKMIALATHNHAAALNDVMPQNIIDKNGKALLSWRVQLLPFLEGENELYKQFRLDESWDSEHNFKLLEKLPKVFESPRAKTKKKGFTVYMGFEGKGAIFGSGLKIGQIPDGTSNTILCVESSVAVPWTKPVDLPFDPKKDMRGFGKAYDGQPIVALCDGSTHVLNKKLSAETLKAAITTSGGEILGEDW
jgi:hypothetical protein